MSQDPFAPRPIAPVDPAPARRTGRGPVVLITGGVLALLLAVGLAVLGGRLFLSALPTGVLDAEGRAGVDVVAEVPAPGRGEVVLEADTTYTVLMRTIPRVMAPQEHVTVTAPDGTDLVVSAAVPSMEAVRGGYQARSIAQFTTREAGTHVLDAPEPAHDSPASVLLVESDGTGAFVGGILGTIASVFGALTLGALGLGLLVGGLIWRHVRRRPRSAVVQDRP